MHKIVSLFFFILLITVCDAKEHKDDLSSGLTKTHLPDASSKTPDKSSPIKLAKVNDHVITTEIFTDSKRKKFLNYPKRIQRSIVDRAIEDEILFQSALKHEHNATSFKNQRDRISLGYRLVAKYALLEADINIDDNNLSAKYEQSKDKFKHDKLYEVSDIFVTDLNLSKKIISDLAASKDINTTFRENAKQYSRGHNPESAGYLGYLELKTLPPAMKSALESLKIGHFNTTPAKTNAGYHVLFLHKILPAGYFPFDQVKKMMIYNIKKSAIEKWSNKQIKKLKPTASIEYLFDVEERSEKTAKTTPPPKKVLK